MNLLLPAIVLGLAGSLHCIFMCGPLALALPVGGLQEAEKRVSRVLFLVGRLLVYGTMGALVGLLGQGISWLGGQKVVLLLITVMLFLLVAGWNMDWAVSLRKAIQTGSRKYQQDRPMAAFFLLGMANGLLPCGLVYGALSQSALTNDFLTGAGLMVVFGLFSSWWHFVLMAGVQVRFPKIRLFQILASPRGSLALVTLFLVIRILHSPNRIPDGSQFQKGDKVEITCSPEH